MKTEWSGMDYTVTLTTEDINTLLYYNNPDFRNPGAQLPELSTPVLGHPSQEVLIFSCSRDPEIMSDRRTHDQVYFERTEKGPIVKVTPEVLVSLSLLGERDFWVTRYDWENKIWIRREDDPINHNN